MDHGTAASVIGVAFAVAAVLITVILSVPRKDHTCALHNVVVDSLQKDMAGVLALLEKIETRLNDAIATGKFK